MKQGDACFQDGNEVVVVVDSEQRYQQFQTVLEVEFVFMNQLLALMR